MNKKIIISISVIFTTLLIGVVVLFGYGYYKETKALNSFDLAKKFVTTSNYDDALNELTKAKENTTNIGEINKLEKLCRDAKNIETLYTKENYSEALKGIEDIKKNSYYSLVKENIEDMYMKITKDRVTILKEIK